MDKRQLGQRINMARKDLGITGEKLAELCNINASYLREIESGAKAPSLPLFISICEKLQVSPSYLLQDSLSDPGCVEMDELHALWSNATPKQLKMIRAMIKSALESL